MKDDYGAYVAFTEQGSSASQMIAAKIMDVIARLPGCVGQAADAVSAHTRVKLGGCSQIAQSSQIGKSIFLDTPFHDTKKPKIMVKMVVFVVILERNLYGHPLAGLLW